MSKLARAEATLVNSLKAASLASAKQQNKIVKVESEQTIEVEDEYANAQRPEEDDAAFVRKLEDVPSYDKNRQFPGLARQKIAKKDKHMRALDDFAKWLDGLSEKLEQDLLEKSRKMRADVEAEEIKLKMVYAQLEDDSFLIVRSEAQLFEILATLKRFVADRSSIVSNFATQLDELEKSRADTVTKELMALVDRLVAIAHKLRDEIEHIVENEAADLNQVLISNHKAHAELMELLWKTQIENEVETLQRWEDARRRWRSLRHNKALKDFDEEINSQAYVNPEDRSNFFMKVQVGQEERQERRANELAVLESLTSDTIKCDVVTQAQQRFAEISEDELAAVQDCYNGLCVLRTRLADSAASRVEALRKELHLYGALHLEPDLPTAVATMKRALADTSLSELWRLGGGLKPEFQALVQEMSSDDVAYNRLVDMIQERLEAICCGFDLKAILEKRGRLAQLDKVRSLIVKMRTVPRAEGKGVVESILPELEEILEVETVSQKFRSIVGSCVDEMKAELDRIDDGMKSIPATASLAGPELSATASSAPGTAKGKTAAVKGGKNAKTVAISTSVPTTAGAGPAATPLSQTSAGLPMDGTTSVVSRATTRMKTSNSSAEAERCVDPLLLKAWNRRLGILYFSSDLPDEHKACCNEALTFMTVQRKCNELVDYTVQEQSEKPLSRLDKNYKFLIDSVANFLENQASLLHHSAGKICEFYLALAKAAESHRTQQHHLDEKSADELWDYSEDFRLEREDRETEFEKACQLIRESADHEVLQRNFEAVLQLLEEIQASYRSYHGKSCFYADKYPLTLVAEFHNHLQFISASFDMQPAPSHLLLSTFDEIYKEVVRLNKDLFEENPLVAGVGPREEITEVAPVKDTEPVVYESQNLQGSEEPQSTSRRPSTDEEEDELPSVGALAGEYICKMPLEAFVHRFYEEDPSVPEPEGETKSSDAVDSGSMVVDTTNAASTPPNGSNPTSKKTSPKTQSAVANPAPEPAESAQETHPNYPFLLATEESFEVLPQAEEEELDDAALMRYRERIADAFLVKSQQEIKRYDPHLAEVYLRCETIEKEVREERKRNSDAEYTRTHPPFNKYSKSPLVLALAISPERIVQLLSGIRESLVACLEKEAFDKLAAAKTLTAQRKDALTEELEDRLRLHWPRRGRVETMVKQPREAELIAHKEKTWRLIQNVASKIMEIQSRFLREENNGKAMCDTFVNDIAQLRNSLSGDFRNLASLQAIDAQARATTIKFQADCVNIIGLLSRICNEDTAGVVVFAKDFRKICPPQVPGVEGGYSDAEIEAIEAMMMQQCAEIQITVEEWHEVIHQLQELQSQSLKSQDEFSQKYEKVAQELAMSEGLGQTYGAPRRRAQERLRTEVSRDEQSAGKVDSLLAQLDFVIEEGKKKESEQLLVSHLETEESESRDNSTKEPKPTGFDMLESVNAAWKLLLQTRAAIQERAAYLNVVATAIHYETLPWGIQTNRIPRRIPEDNTIQESAQESLSLSSRSVEAGQPLPTAVQMNILDFYSDVDSTCRKETRELYSKEGKLDMLGDGGVPHSLEHWLAESKDKILGRHGYREKAWKRLWGQIERLELLVARKQFAFADAPKQPETEEENEDDVDGEEAIRNKAIVHRLGVPAVCLRSIAEGLVLFMARDLEEQELQFSKLVAIWELGRDRNERLLRPRLSSPDAAEELAQLDAKEKERSTDLTTNVVRFRAALIKKLVEHTKAFVVDIGECSKGLIRYIDTSLRQELTMVPPDCEVPKKRMTMKRLRKTQRLRQEVAAGGEDRAHSRVWECIALEGLLSLTKSVEDLVPDLAAAAAPVETAVKSPPPPKKGAAASAAAVPVEAPSLLSSKWKLETDALTAVRGEVSSAHRAVLAERDAAVERFLVALGERFSAIREKYNLLLQQEGSWCERWTRQVNMLKSGTV